MLEGRSKKFFIAILGAWAGVSFSLDWGNMYYTKHNLYRKGDKQLPTYTYDKSSFNIFCFACHIRAVPYTGNSKRFTTYAYGRKSLSKDHIYPQTLVCFSCHDGFIASNISPSKREVHHPFFVAYREERFVLRPLETPLVGWVGARTISDLVSRFDNTLQCVSCHDPHVRIPIFLRRTNEGSAFCLSCHEK